MKRLALTTAVLVLAIADVTSAGAAGTTTVQYGKQAEETAVLYPAGPVPLLLLHEKGQTANTIKGQAKTLQSEGFTVFDLEWESERGEALPLSVGQIQDAIAFARSQTLFPVDPNSLVMVGGSRGALLGLLAAERANNASPGAVKAVVSLSGQVDPQAAIERAQRGELAQGMIGNLAQAYDCTRNLSTCLPSYVREWSPIDTVTRRAPAMFLAASEGERKAWPSDQYEMAEALRRAGVESSVAIVEEGHGYGYWGKIREQGIAFLLHATHRSLAR